MKLMRSLQAVGIEPYVIYSSGRGLKKYRENRKAFLAQAGDDPLWPLGDAYPCLSDRYDVSGVAKGQYFHQDLLVAQQIHAAKPERHVDVGSRVDGFVAHVAAFMPIEVVDIRPLTTTAENITFTQRDLMIADPEFDDYTDSLSCLHTLEHFGLGRYGDPVDYDGYRKGFDNLARMVRPGGTFYLSVPISRRQRIEFDAHRLFEVPHVVELVEDQFDIKTAAIVNDAEDVVRDVDVRSAEGHRSFDVEYGCIMLDLRKRHERSATTPS
ncbi:DUF268 domain-containing protein [Nocardioides iriomotensis]|nr:DUF268 domain-containing protein [Nocardioides iriomotensis]